MRHLLVSELLSIPGQDTLEAGWVNTAHVRSGEVGAHTMIGKSVQAVRTKEAMSVVLRGSPPNPITHPGQGLLESLGLGARYSGHIPPKPGLP